MYRQILIGNNVCFACAGLLLPVLGALPDSLIIIVSGLGVSREVAQEQVGRHGAFPLHVKPVNEGHWGHIFILEIVASPFARVDLKQLAVQVCLCIQVQKVTGFMPRQLRHLEDVNLLWGPGEGESASQ
jgi:hypothetical protein